jgi:hypothetical protein
VIGISYALSHVIAEFGRGRRNSSKCLARGCKGALAGEVRPCDESLFEFMEMRRESRWEGRERTPLGRWEGHGLFVGTFASQTYNARSVRQIHTGRIGI